MSNKVLLSISILISNRPDTVEKCLKSLHHLRETVPCELILTDTGCGEQVRKIIKPYADVLLEFEWCNDFSKARNLGLDAAKGEWFLYMDDDEWFEDTKEIEEFFLSGEYKNYTNAYYKVRNYSDFSGKKYNEGMVSRMAKLRPGVRFINPIHEGLAQVEGKTKTLQSFVHHYGYAYQNDIERYRHYKRNIGPLLKMIEEEPAELHHYVQAAQEYNTVKQFQESIEISEKGIAAFDHENRSILYLNALFVNIVERYVGLSQYEDAIQKGEEYLENEVLTTLGQARIAAPLVTAAFELEQYDKCRKYTDIYMGRYREYQIDSSPYLEQAACFMYGCFKQKHIDAVCIMGAIASLRKEDYRTAEELLGYVELENKNSALEVKLCEQVVKSYIKEEQFSEHHPCVTILNKLLEYPQFVSVIIHYFEIERKENPDMVNVNYDKWQYLKSDCWYIQYLQLDIHNPDKNERLNAFFELWKNTDVILPKSINLGLWTLAEEADVDMEVLIGFLPYYKWRKAVNAACSSMSQEQLDSLHEQIIKKFSLNDNKILYWRASYAFKQLANVKDTSVSSKKEMKENGGIPDERNNFDFVSKMFSELKKAALCLAEKTYRAEVLEAERDMLPEYIQAAFCIEELQKCVDNENYGAAIRELKTINEVMPSISTAVKIYTKWIEQQIHQQEVKQTAQQQAISAEMQQLASAIKEKILLLLTEENNDVAMQLIMQLESIIGKDEELEAFKRQIGKG